MQPLKVVRRYCRQCKAEGGVAKCLMTDCPLWPHRLGMSVRKAKRVGLLPGDFKPGVSSALRAIREHCVACCAGNYHEVNKCPSEWCALWPLRFGMTLPTARRRGRKVDASEGAMA